MYPSPFTTPGLAKFAEEVDAERGRQLAKFGDQRHPDGTGLSGDHGQADMARRICQKAAGNGSLAWRHILQEEVREALAESDPAKLRAELIQIAAVVQAWVSDLDQRVYPCAHCGQPISEDGATWTWVGSLPEPGQPRNLAPRYHSGLNFPGCRAASGAFGPDEPTP